MGENKAIHAYHDGKHDVFILSDFECLQMHVACLLVILGIELYPPAITSCHRILLIIPDVNWGRHCPVDTSHDDRKPHSCNIKKHLDHEQKSLRCGGSVRSCPCRT